MNVTATALQGLDRAAAVGMLAAKNMYEANLNLMKTAQEMDKHLLDVLG